MCILKVPAGNISNNHPFRSFVEDRSWSATTAYKKIQFFAATAKHKHNLMLNVINEERVASAPCLLGSISKGRRRRKNVPKEDYRLQKSMQLVRRATFLPVEFASLQLRRLPRQSLGGCSSCLRDSRSQILAYASDAL